MKIFVGISGASGVDLGLCLLLALEKFTKKNDEIFAVISKGARLSFWAENLQKGVNFWGENSQKNEQKSVNFLSKISQKSGTKPKNSVNFLEKNEFFAKNSRQNETKKSHENEIKTKNSRPKTHENSQNFLQNLPTNDEFIALLRRDFELKKTHFFDDENLAASIASGSFGVKKSIIAPCSLNTLAKIRCGIADTLIARCAAVALKEGRALVLGVRESPLGAIALKQMFKLAKMGVIIAPPMFAGYGAKTADFAKCGAKMPDNFAANCGKMLGANAQTNLAAQVPQSADIRDFVVGKWLDVLDIPHTLYKKWEFGL